MERGRQSDASDLSPREAMERWLKRQRSDKSQSTVYTYKYRLKLFVEWCEEIEIDRIGDLQPLDIDEYYGVRSRIADTSHENEMKTLRLFLQYLDDVLGAVEDGLPDAVRIPDVDKEDRSSETVLATEDARTLIQHFRHHDDRFGCKWHAFLELAWWTAARRGALAGLDVRDVDLDDGFVNFVHRPETSTPLKKKMFGQRSVSLSPVIADVLQTYIDENRRELHDDNGREPLFTTQQGRPAPTTIAGWSYQATQPCWHQDCPHGKERTDCGWTRQSHASKCPSSRSPHPIRSGSVTWQLNCGLPPAVVASRVNATLETIRWHYDWATTEQRWTRLHEHREQRREHVANLSVIQ